MAKNTSDAVVEAKIFESCLKNKQFEYPIYCDMEYGNLSKKENTNICKVFCNYLESQGFYVGIYANLNWFKNKLYLEELKSYDKWIAHYVKNIDFSKYKNSDYDMWQFNCQTRFREGYPPYRSSHGQNRLFLLRRQVLLYR